MAGRGARLGRGPGWDVKTLDDDFMRSLIGSRAGTFPAHGATDLPPSAMRVIEVIEAGIAHAKELAAQAADRLEEATPTRSP